jgi:Bacterial toxin 44
MLIDRAGLTACDCSIPEHPPNANINDNIKGAERARYLEFLTGVPMLLQLPWFWQTVASGGPQDYKRQGRTWQDATGINAYGTPVPSPYQDFGNFNYGAVGAAAGYPLQVLERGAGAYQLYVTKNSRPEWGGPFDRHGPYGDDPQDQAQILAGYNYYMNGCNKK